jgi:hypothetical protein
MIRMIQIRILRMFNYQEPSQKWKEPSQKYKEAK